MVLFLIALFFVICVSSLLALYWQEIKAWYKKRRFYQAAVSVGLPVEYRHMLWQLVEIYRPQGVDKLLMNSRLLNKILLKAINDLELNLSISLKDRELLQCKYYEIKRFFDRITVTPSLRTTKELRKETQIIFNKPQNVRLTFLGWVTDSSNLGFWLRLDKVSSDQWVTLSEHGEFEFLYTDEHTIEHHFVSKLKQVREENGVITLFFLHTKAIELIVERRPPLRRFNQEAVIAKAELVVDKLGQRQFLPQKEVRCQILELSLASAVIKSLDSYDVNQFVYLQFMGNTQRVVCYGRVEKTIQVAPHYWQIQVQFLQTSRASLNQISSLVYDL